MKTIKNKIFFELILMGFLIWNWCFLVIQSFIYIASKVNWLSLDIFIDDFVQCLLIWCCKYWLNIHPVMDRKSTVQCAIKTEDPKRKQIIFYLSNKNVNLSKRALSSFVTTETMTQFDAKVEVERRLCEINLRNSIKMQFIFGLFFQHLFFIVRSSVGAVPYSAAVVVAVVVVVLSVVVVFVVVVDWFVVD